MTLTLFLLILAAETQYRSLSAGWTALFRQHPDLSPTGLIEPDFATCKLRIQARTLYSLPVRQLTPMLGTSFIQPLAESALASRSSVTSITLTVVLSPSYEFACPRLRSSCFLIVFLIRKQNCYGSNLPIRPISPCQRPFVIIFK